MAVSLDSSTPDYFKKVSTSCRISPSSDKRFWSSLRNRVDALLENRNPSDTQFKSGECDRAKMMKDDSLLLLKGFDSVSHSLLQLSKNLDNAIQGARDLAKPPTITDIYHSAIEQAKSKGVEVEKEVKEEKDEDGESERGLKRKIDEVGDDSENENAKIPKDEGKLHKAKTLAMSMATKAASLARELKSIKSDLCFMKERCTILEEENRRLRDGYSEGIMPEEDDLVRLQLEALLAEKSRLANENANLTRENQCLHQLVEYHQITSQDLSASYENVIKGLCLDFSSPTQLIPGGGGDDEYGSDQALRTPRMELSGFDSSLDEFYDEEEPEEECKVED